MANNRCSLVNYRLKPRERKGTLIIFNVIILFITPEIIRTTGIKIATVTQYYNNSDKRFLNVQTPPPRFISCESYLKPTVKPCTT